MKQGLFTIQENVALNSNVYKMVVKGDTSAITSAGQFVNIKIDGLHLHRSPHTRSVNFYKSLISYASNIISKYNYIFNR